MFLNISSGMLLKKIFNLSSVAEFDNSNRFNFSWLIAMLDFLIAVSDPSKTLIL